MIDYLRNLTKSAEEKQQEALNAYLDDALSPKERQRFEQQLARDADLRQEVEQRRALQAQMRQMPRRRVPRNFTLDPAVYGRPQRQPLFQLYPAMRVAAVLTAIFFILAIGVELFLPGQANLAGPGSAPQDVAMVEEAAEEPAGETAVEAPLAAQAVEVTRVVTEVVTEDEAVLEEAAPLAEVPAEEEMVEAADFAQEESLPEAEAPPPQENEPATTDAAGAASGDTGQEPAATAPLPTSSPAPTLTAPAAIDATKSTVPRPEAETTTSERAATAVPTPQPETISEAVTVEATAVPVTAPAREPISGLRWLQIGLGVLLILLVTAVFYVRRHTI